jgi:tetratricopeptide (TPR) repeat protein
MTKRIIAFTFASAFFISVYAQEMRPLQDVFLEAEYFFVTGEYMDALPYYLQLYKELPENANLAYRIGVCYLNIAGRKSLSVEYLEAAARNMSGKHKEGTITQTSAPYDALYDLALAYRINFRFDKAKETFMRFSETLLPDDRENIDFINHQIKICDTAKELIAAPVSFTEENMGELINDEKSNFNPLISADGKTFAYMTSMKFYDAIMLTKLVDGKWDAPVNITPELETDGDMYISCLSSDGKMLYLSKDDDFNSDLFNCSYDGIRWRKSIPLKSINTKYWESHGFVSEDGDVLIFASDRPGGFGGLDLYIAKKTGEDWGTPVNIGPEINTPFNEDRPFLINDGKTLFFSSQGHKNIGGYDLFRSELQPNNLWSTPENLGYPVNTPDDDIFFMPEGNGESGYYSRYREYDGYGKEDIYRITLK